MVLVNYNVLAQDKVKPLTQKERIEVVNAIGKELNENYVFPDVAEKMAKHISKQNKKRTI
jgi:ribose 5-phosphate isomerase RpiB